MERMKGKQESNDRARPDFRCHEPKCPKEKHDVRGVKKDVGQMESGRSCAEKAGVELQREPCQRMPVGSVRRSKCPSHIFTRQTSEHVTIVLHINRVVPVRKTVPTRLSEDNYRGREEKR